MIQNTQLMMMQLKKRWMSSSKGCLLACCIMLLFIILLTDNQVLGQLPPLPPGQLEKLAFLFAGSSAKTVCSLAFIAKRKPSATSPYYQELEGDLAKFYNITIDLEKRRVFSSASKVGLPQIVRIATFNDMYGCLLLDGLKHVENMKNTHALKSSKFTSSSLAGMNWNISTNAIVQQTVDQMFDTSIGCNNRAVVVIKDRKLIAEKYLTPTFNADSMQVGNSMTKSILNALIGKRVLEGKISINEPVNAPEWKNARNSITVDIMLRMISGLEWNENYDDVFSDVSIMLYDYLDAAKYAANKTLTSLPKSTFYYSSGTSNILSRKLRETFNGQDSLYWQYPYDFFNMIGIERKNAMIESDPTLNFVASSYAWLSARDWAKFGQLYLDDGVVFWSGKRILPEGWVSYTTTETRAPNSPRTFYGAHFWLEPEPAPKNTFLALGYKGQRVLIVPERNMLIVRLGNDDSVFNPPCNIQEWERKIIEAASKL